MPIHVILGKPGSGKSLYATDRLIKELVETKRNIVTNLPIRPERLNEFLQKRYPNLDLRMPQRVRILSDEEMSKFWSIRGPNPIDRECPADLPVFNFIATPGATGVGKGIEVARFEREQSAYKAELSKRDEEQQEWLAYAGDAEGREGVAYFLDEAHIAFNARDWATIGRGALHYLSQHRKLGDVVWPITQACGNLDKQFRSVAEDFTVLRNEYTAKFGMFRGRGRFVRRTYLSEPSGNAEPFETASFELDKDGVASCYDTAKGIGVHGNKADIGRRAKGIPIWTVVPAALVLALSCVFIPWLLGKGVAKVAQTKTADISKAVYPMPKAPGSAPAVVPAEVRKNTFEASEPVSLSRFEPPKGEYDGVTVSGYAVSSRGARVQLSDGRVLESGDGILSSIGKNSVVLLDGTKLWLKAGKLALPRPVVAHRDAARGDSYRPTEPEVPKPVVSRLGLVSGTGKGATGEIKTFSFTRK